MTPPLAAGDELVGGFEETPPAAVHVGFGAHVGAEHETVLVLFDEGAAGAGLAAKFVVAGGDVEEEVGVGVEHFGESGKVVALVAEVAEDEGGFGVLSEETVAGGEQLFVGGDVFAHHREVLEVWGALLVGTEGTPAGRMVGDVDVGGDFEFSDFAPEGVEARVVDVEALVAREGFLFGTAESPAFVGEFADATRAFAVAAFEFGGGVFRVVGIHRTPDLEAVGVAGEEEVGLAVEFGADGSGEDDGFFDANFVHDFDPGVDVGGGLDVGHVAVGVDVDGGVHGLGDGGFLDAKGAFGGVVFEENRIHGSGLDVDAVFEISLFGFLFRLGLLRGGLGGAAEQREEEEGKERGSHVDQLTPITVYVMRALAKLGGFTDWTDE